MAVAQCIFSSSESVLPGRVWFVSTGSIGIKSFMGLPKTHCAGESSVSGSGVLRYWRIARCS